MSEPTSYLRAYPTTLEERGLTNDGRKILTGRLVPYGVATDVCDDLPDGRRDYYREGFVKGAFEPQVLDPGGRKLAQRISLWHRHELRGADSLGNFRHLEERDDGLYGDVAVFRDKTALVEDLLADGINELSVEFRPRAEDHTLEENGVRWRKKTHLDGVALVAKGAYNEAQVLQFREADDGVEREKAEKAESEKADAEAEAERERRAAAAVAEAEERRQQWEELTGPSYERIKAQQVDLVATLMPGQSLPRRD
jgi:HK97 family phage prohead protease